GKNLFRKTVLFPVNVITRVLFFLRIPARIRSAHSSALIILLSSIGVSPCDAPSLLRAAWRILLVVKPGQTHITCTPSSRSSVFTASSQPWRAYLLAEYALRPGRPR